MVIVEDYDGLPDYQTAIFLLQTQSFNVPDDWELRFTLDRKPYYADNTTKTTHWPPPIGWRICKNTEGILYYIHIDTNIIYDTLPNNI